MPFASKQKEFFLRLLKSDSVSDATMLIGEDDFKEMTIDSKMKVLCWFLDLKSKDSETVKEFIYRHFIYRGFSAIKGKWADAQDLDKWINTLLSIYYKKLKSEGKTETKFFTRKPRDDVIDEIADDIKGCSMNVQRQITKLCDLAFQKSSVEQLIDLKNGIKDRIQMLIDEGLEGTQLEEARLIEKVYRKLLQHVEKREMK